MTLDEFKEYINTMLALAGDTGDSSVRAQIVITAMQHGGGRVQMPSELEQMREIRKAQSVWPNNAAVGALLPRSIG